MTDAFQTTAVKSGTRRAITIQAFERTVLTFDPLNPSSGQVVARLAAYKVPKAIEFRAALPKT